MQITADCSSREEMIGNDGPQGGTPDLITARALLSLLESQDYRCALTGRELTPETAALDHRTPLSRGGPNTISNCQVVHEQANAAKATMTHEEFVALCREVVLNCGSSK